MAYYVRVYTRKTDRDKMCAFHSIRKKFNTKSGRCEHIHFDTIATVYDINDRQKCCMMALLYIHDGLYR